jgi:anaerobic carbon-monoxide dehydrogenase iron sulfur subunit
MKILFSGDKCTGCKLCTLACSGSRIGAFSENLSNIGIASFYNGDNLETSARLCNLCNTCIENCPSEALSRGKGVITLDRDKCTSCGQCADSCPQKVIYMWEDYPMLCNLCDRDPWCVKLCTKGALATEEVEP